jgi:hypothetical protein
MVQIQNLNLWVNGNQVIADRLLVILTNDNLSSFASFTYIIGQATDNPITPLKNLISGTLLLDGQDYIDWDNSNEQAYEIVAGKLNLTII